MPREPLRFQQQQYTFTHCIRSPGSPLPAGIDGRRMSLYAELIFNGLDEQMSAIFPILRSLLDDERWQAMLHDYLIRHRARTPLFTEIGAEFVNYLEHERKPNQDDPPFLAELAHFEYAELAVAIIDAEREGVPFDPDGDLLDGHPAVTPSLWNLTYRYPVHAIGPDNPNPEPAPTSLVIYRDQDEQVHFLEINQVTQHLLLLIDQQPRASGRQLLEQIAAELQHPDTTTVLHHGAELLLDLRVRNVVLGSIPVEPKPHT